MVGSVDAGDARRELPGFAKSCVVLKFCVALLTGMVAIAVGCGEPGAPQPPSLNLPVPVRDLTATRTGNSVHLTWKSTTRTTDHAPLTGTIRTRICRMEGNGPCELATEQPLKPGQPEQFDDALPSEELQGQPQLLTYYVELLNHAQKSAGRSNAAYSASGQAAPEIASLTASVRPEGVELHWAPVEWPAAEGSARLVRITRLDQSPPKPKPMATAGTKSLLAPSSASAPPLQTLEVVSGGEHSAKGEALDPSAQFGESYRYEARCVEKLMLDGHAIELVGALSQPATILTKDVFPPAVPQQLAAASDGASHAIDLSWSPDSEPDLAGYFVYRREASGSAAAERISGMAPLPAPAFHDAHVTPDVAYAYSVSAVDTSGNESARSAEAQETLSAPR
jgi:hypothetical protein